MIGAALASLIPTTARRYGNASLENPLVGLTSAAVEEMFTASGRSSAGVSVNHDNALTIAAVYQAVSLISGDVAKLPLYPYKRMKDDDREIADKHPAYFPVAIRANPYKSAKRFWRDMMVHCLLWTNGYGYISRSGGKIELYNLLPDRTAPEWHEGRLIYVTEVDGKLKPLDPSQVLHVRGISSDGMKGLDLTKYARDDWGLEIAARNFESKFFKNGARIGGTLELPTGMSKPARDTVEEGFRKTYEEGDNPFKTVILRDGAKFHSGQVTPQAGQVSELRTDRKREVASRFNLPPSMLGIMDSKAYNSYEQDRLSYLHGCLHHWTEPIADECDMKLLTEAELRSDAVYFEHNVSKFTAADWGTQVEKLVELRNAEIVSPNEVRKKLNLPKRDDPDGDKYINPNTKSAQAAAEPSNSAKDIANAVSELLMPDIDRALSASEGRVANRLETNNAALPAAVAGAIVPAVEEVGSSMLAAQAETNGIVTMGSEKIQATVAANQEASTKEAEAALAAIAAAEATTVAACKAKASARIRDQHRPLIVDGIGRFTKRLATDARRAAKSTANFSKWLGDDHATMFDTMLNSSAIAVASLDERNPIEVLQAMRVACLASVVGNLRRSYNELPQGESLLAKVDPILDSYERSTPDKVANAILENSNV